MLEFDNPMACPACGHATSTSRLLRPRQPGEDSILACCGACGCLYVGDGKAVRSLTARERKMVPTYLGTELLKAEHDRIVARLWG